MLRYLICGMVGLMAFCLVAGGAEIDPATEAVIRESLPAGDFEWRLLRGAGFLSIHAQDPASGRNLLWIQVIVHEEMTKEYAQSYRESCNGLPAMRTEDRWVWVLMGRVELRVSARAAVYRSDKELDAFVGGFNREVLQSL